MRTKRAKSKLVKQILPDKEDLICLSCSLPDCLDKSAESGKIEDRLCLRYRYQMKDPVCRDCVVFWCNRMDKCCKKRKKWKHPQGSCAECKLQVCIDGTRDFKCLKYRHRLLWARKRNKERYEVDPVFRERYDKSRPYNSSNFKKRYATDSDFREVRKKYVKEWKEENKEQQKEYWREYWRKNKDKLNQKRRKK